MGRQRKGQEKWQSEQIGILTAKKGAQKSLTSTWTKEHSGLLYAIVVITEKIKYKDKKNCTHDKTIDSTSMYCLLSTCTVNFLITFSKYSL